MHDNISVLVIEDDHLTAMTVKSLITELGYETLAVVGTEDEAFNLALTRKPDIILADINLTVGNGITAVQRITEFDSIPIVIMTSDLSAQAKNSAASLNPVAFLTKPVSRYALQDALIRASEQGMM